MDELANFFAAIGFLLFVGFIGAVLLITIAVAVITFAGWIVYEGGCLVAGWASARLRR